jgi:hypothetical protein
MMDSLRGGWRNVLTQCLSWPWLPSSYLGFLFSESINSWMLFHAYLYNSLIIAPPFLYDRKTLHILLALIFQMGFAFLVVASFSAAFISDSPFRSPFSDFVNFIFRIFPDKPIPNLSPTSRLSLAHDWRRSHFHTMLVAGGYFVLKGDLLLFSLHILRIAGVFALMRKGKERTCNPVFSVCRNGFSSPPSPSSPVSFSQSFSPLVQPFCVSFLRAGFHPAWFGGLHWYQNVRNETDDC